MEFGASFDREMNAECDYDEASALVRAELAAEGVDPATVERTELARRISIRKRQVFAERKAAERPVG